MGITKQEGENIRKIKRIADIALAVLLAAIVLLAVKLIKKDFGKIKQKPSDDAIISSESSASSEVQPIFVSEGIESDKIYQGTLILVNGSAEYKWDDEGLKSIMEIRNDDGTDCYSVMDNDVKAREEAAKALNAMLKAFNKETGHDDIRVDSAYRSVEEQQELYDSAEDNSNVSKPGTSDYHTGYSIDLNVVDEDGESLDFDGTGDYEWFGKNCFKYGFVLRYPEGKEDITDQEYRPWHFRYVGKVHAAYMNENNLCLEEYLDKLKSRPYDGEHLETKDPDGKNYEIYYFASDLASTVTSVAVPSEREYSISGNNTDGFIITAKAEDDQDIGQDLQNNSSENGTEDTSESSENETSEEDPDKNDTEE